MIPDVETFSSVLLLTTEFQFLYVKNENTVLQVSVNSINLLQNSQLIREKMANFASVRQERAEFVIVWFLYACCHLNNHASELLLV